MNRRVLIGAICASMILLLVACGSEAVEQAQVISVPATPIPTTAPMSVPTTTPTPVPASTPTALPEVTSTPVPTPTVAPTAVPTQTLDPTPIPAADPAPAATVVPTATAAAEVIETPTPVPTPTVEEIETEEPEVEEDASGSETEPTAVAETPTAVVAAGELPVECYDGQVGVYRAYVDGVDDLSFVNGLVSCSGAGTNAVSAANSYRHSTGLIVQRNGDYIFDESGTAYIPYSGSLHFCVNGQPASAPVRAETVPALLIVIDNEAQRQVAQGAIGPASFTGSGSQC